MTVYKISLNNIIVLKDDILEFNRRLEHLLECPDEVLDIELIKNYLYHSNMLIEYLNNIYDFYMSYGGYND